MEMTPFSPLAWGSPDAVFDRLEGAWDLDRTIEGKATMLGTARFKRHDGARLAYREEGRTRLPDGRSFEGHREYVFEGAADGFRVYFAEMPLRLFHRIAIVREGDQLVGAAGHLCEADQYDSVYRFLADGTFVIAHLVKGPRKDYLSRTVFRRHGA